jgi:hypothetical protein
MWPAGTRRRDDPPGLKPERANAGMGAAAFTARQARVGALNTADAISGATKNRATLVTIIPRG